MSEYDQGVLQADAAKEMGVKFIIWSTLPYVGPDFMGLGGVELYDCELLSVPCFPTFSDVTRSESENQRLHQVNWCPLCFCFNTRVRRQRYVMATHKMDR